MCVYVLIWLLERSERKGWSSSRTLVLLQIFSRFFCLNDLNAFYEGERERAHTLSKPIHLRRPALRGRSEAKVGCRERETFYTRDDLCIRENDAAKEGAFTDSAPGEALSTKMWTETHLNADS